MPPLPKTLSARATIPIKSLVLLSKSERFYDVLDYLAVFRNNFGDEKKELPERDLKAYSVGP